MKLNVQTIVENRIASTHASTNLLDPAQVQFSATTVSNPMALYQQIDFSELEEAYNTLGTFIRHVAQGNCRGLILTGPPGVGKTSSTTSLLKQYSNKPFKVIAGNVSPFNLYVELFRHSNAGEIIVLDDADSFLSSVDGINIVKAATDSTSQRQISWVTANPMLKAWGIPKNFSYDGALILISNERLGVFSKGRMALHLAALTDRLRHLAIGTNNKEEQFFHLCYYVVKHGLLRSRGVMPAQEREILDYIADHIDRLSRISLRTATNLAELMLLEPKGWKTMAKHSLLSLDKKEGI